MNKPEIIDDTEMLDEIRSSMKRYKKDKSNLIPLLQMIQQKHRFLSDGAISLVAEYLNISNCEVYGVATFYNEFRFTPPGKHAIKVCLGTACHVRGGEIILENFERKLGIKAGETTPDREFSVDRVACIGCCALAPVAVVDDKVHSHVAPSKVEGLFLGFDIEKKMSGGGRDTAPAPQGEPESGEQNR